MKNQKIRDAIDAYVDEQELEDVLLFDNQAYDNSIIGITNDGHVVYDYDKMIQELLDDNKDWEYTDAVEWLEYNTLRALPYAKGNAPIIMYDINKILWEE